MTKKNHKTKICVAKFPNLGNGTGSMIFLVKLGVMEFK